ncbi:hypothetical protein MJG53_005332 [Ovis ammon polii x Ovis aries]|uniref:Uncharacterized protein n=1 Tax=Ovis ammon polii x Ovis aries TaxID=2918886 RepID=A0ACB9VDH6_9CETA|nr:hypothetical protein MJG53_005332 [Ovis ammon polii x Ovis aries]
MMQESLLQVISKDVANNFIVMLPDNGFYCLKGHPCNWHDAARCGYTHFPLSKSDFRSSFEECHLEQYDGPWIDYPEWPGFFKMEQDALFCHCGWLIDLQPGVRVLVKLSPFFKQNKSQRSKKKGDLSKSEEQPTTWISSVRHSTAFTAWDVSDFLWKTDPAIINQTSSAKRGATGRGRQQGLQDVESDLCENSLMDPVLIRLLNKDL